MNNKLLLIALWFCGTVFSGPKILKPGSSWVGGNVNFSCPCDQYRALDRLIGARLFFTPKGSTKIYMIKIQRGKHVSDFFNALATKKIRIKGRVRIKGPMIQKGIPHYIYLHGDDVRISTKKPSKGWKY